MRKIAARLKQHEWTQAEAASRCGVTQPRINDLLRGKVSRFSLDVPVDIATALGCRVRVDAALGLRRSILKIRTSLLAPSIPTP